MALKAMVTSLEDLEEPLRALYTKVSDTEYVLEVDDGDYKSKLSEFRDTNVALATKMKDLEGLKEKYKDVDLEKYSAALSAVEELQKTKDKKLIDEGKIEELLQEKTERLRADYEGKIDALSKDLDKTKGLADKYTGLYSKQAIDGNVISTLAELKAEINPGAMQDILARARNVWAVDDDSGDLRPSKNGNTMMGKDPNVALTMGEWATELVSEAPWLFKGSQGGGAGGSGTGGSGNGSVVNPGDQEVINANLEDIASGKVVVGEAQ